MLPSPSGFSYTLAVTVLRPSRSSLLLGGLFFVLAYGSVRYVPVFREFRLVQDLCAELGRRAASSRDEAGSRAWFDRRAQEEGLPWLTSSDLYWKRIDPDHLDVGIRYRTELRHLGLWKQGIGFVWYCHGSVASCEPFVPSFEDLE